MKEIKTDRDREVFIKFLLLAVVKVSRDRKDDEEYVDKSRNMIVKE
jgi:hypothetical protein